MPERIEDYIKERLAEFNHIPQERLELLDEMSDWINEQLNQDLDINFIFICTHNSRRSHMAQIWAQTAAYYYHVPRVHCYSGGTEATAFNPRAVRAMLNAGFDITPESDDENPIYLVKYADDQEPLKCWSKKYNDPANPQQDFTAVMTCSAADSACPIVIGADERFAITYQDPQEYDDTPMEKEQYDKRCAQIATEMLYVFSKSGSAI